MDIFYVLRSEKSKHGGTELLLHLRFYNVRTKISNMFSTLASKNPKHFFLHLDMKVFQVKDDALTNLNESIFENHDCTKAGLILLSFHF